MVQPIPDGYHSVTPYLIVNKAAEALDWYVRAFGATELMRLPGPDGALMHSEFKIGNSIIMMADENPQMGFVGPESLGGAAVSIGLYVEDVDTMFSKAIAEGATELRPVQDQFYGDRSGTLKDPFGHTWTVSTHVEDVTEAEIQKRLSELFPGS